MSKDNSDYKKSMIKPQAKGNDTVLKDLQPKVADTHTGKQPMAKKKK